MELTTLFSQKLQSFKQHSISSRLIHVIAQSLYLKATCPVLPLFISDRYYLLSCRWCYVVWTGLDLEVTDIFRRLLALACFPLDKFKFLTLISPSGEKIIHGRLGRTCRYRKVVKRLKSQEAFHPPVPSGEGSSSSVGRSCIVPTDILSRSGSRIWAAGSSCVDRLLRLDGGLRNVVGICGDRFSSLFRRFA